MAQTDIFTSSGTWVCPPNVTAVMIECWAAGGGGGGAQVIFGHSPGFASGGGGGAYSKLNTFSVTPGNSYTVTVGVGGNPGLFSDPSGSFAQDGGDSWFNSTGTVLAKGGKGGQTAGAGLAAASGTGGPAASGVGDVKHSGGNGASTTGGPGGPSGGGGGGAGSTGNGGDASGSSPGTGTTIGGGDGGSGQSSLNTNGGNGLSLGGGGGGAVGNGNGGSGNNGHVNITYTATSQQLSDADSSVVTDRPRILLPGTHSSPVITFRQATTPWSVLSLLTYKQETPGGSDLPVLDNNDSNPILFRIYNNFLLSANVADALNPSLTSFDGVGVHTASMPVASQRWIHAWEYGFGQSESAPGLYTVGKDVDTTIGGNSFQYTIPYGSDGQSPSAIRAGVDGKGCGFIEIRSYARVPGLASGGLQTFALSVSFDWTS